MKIVDKSNNESLCFESLELADTFKFDDRVFMKVSNNEDREINAYDFSKGRLTNISGDTIVNVNIKMIKKWKIKMYIFQDLFLSLCFHKGSFFF